jgi:hypothetical protein
MARWALQKYDHPVRAQSQGGFDVFDSDQETPNTQLSSLEYADGTRVQVEVRGLYTNADADIRMGLLFYGSEGWMKLSSAGWATYYGRENEPGAQERRSEDAPNSGDLHCANFIEAVRSGDRSLQKADILEGHLSTTMCHLCNIAYRTGRSVEFDSEKEDFLDDEEANRYVKRTYRYPYVLPDLV